MRETGLTPALVVRDCTERVCVAGACFTSPKTSGSPRHKSSRRQGTGPASVPPFPLPPRSPFVAFSAARVLVAMEPSVVNPVVCPPGTSVWAKRQMRRLGAPHRPISSSPPSPHHPIPLPLIPRDGRSHPKSLFVGRATPHCGQRTLHRARPKTRRIEVFWTVLGQNRGPLGHD